MCKINVMDTTCMCIQNLLLVVYVQMPCNAWCSQSDHQKQTGANCLLH